MEYPYDCTEQLVNRYFANQLAYQTVSTKPVLEQVFRKWEADSTALLSELEKNQDLKTALLTETPWVREAQSEAEQRAPHRRALPAQAAGPGAGTDPR